MTTIGLNSKEAAEKLKHCGPNKIESGSQVSPWRILFEQFKSPLVLILIFACILSAVLGEFAEAIAISTILLINALIGFFQEYRAESAVNALMEMTAPQARVLRDGAQKLIPATEVVPNDIILLEGGDIVAADAEILEASRLQVNESVLTGESLPVQKDAEGLKSGKSIVERNGMVFMGTSVTQGTSRIKVKSTGMQTELGRIAHLLNTTSDTTTPLQDQLFQVGRSLLAICFVVVAIVFGIGLLQGRDWMELSVFALSLAVAAVPEGMPALVTVALAFGVQRMAEKKALIRKLPSVETLGSVSVICTDKTGTLTTGQMRVRELWGQDHRQLLETGASCCDSELGSDRASDIGDTTEIAILLAALEHGIEKNSIEKSNPRVKTEPFDSDRKRMSVARADGIVYVKGGPESVLSVCNPSTVTSEFHKALQDMSSRGLRVLAIARGQGQDEKDLNLLGLIGIADPPRVEAAQSISEAKAAGILSVMITGDHPVTASAIAKELGLAEVHARATPQDKLDIVRKWKSKGAIVAMTGDGVNDAPALREAHIGVAMGRTGTQVTRQSADMVLADDNFATIVSAVREGRGVYRNIRKAVIYLLTGNFAELFMVLGASLLAIPVPFMAPHLLWINLVTDSLPGLALIADPTSQDIMKSKPRPQSEKILGRTQWLEIGLVGTIEAISIGILFWIQLKTNGIDQARNLAFTTMVTSQLLRSLAARSRTQTFWQVGVLNNLWLVGVVVITFLLQISLHFIPLTQRVFGLAPIGVAEFLWILPFAVISVSFLEISKLIQPTDKTSNTVS